MRRILRRLFLIVGTIVVVLGYGAMFVSALMTTSDPHQTFTASKK